MYKLLLIINTLIIATSCLDTTSKKETNASKNVSLTAAGATFPMPFYNQVISEYFKQKGIKINYGGIGSGGGIRSLKDKLVDFGATDAFLSPNEEADFSAPIVHVPTCLGAIVIAYNLPGVPQLRLTNQALSKIFLGEITKWNDPAIQECNSGIKLPDLNIKVIYRSDGSGTTYIFSDYLSKVSLSWAQKVGTGKSLEWPTGLGAKGNPGISGTILQTTGAIGYIGSEYAFAQKIAFVMLQNKSGNFVSPSVKSVSAAGRIKIPADSRIMLTNSSDPDAYPISALSWVILYKDQAYNNRTRHQAEETVRFIDFLTSSDVQSIAPKVDYTPLNENTIRIAKDILKTITYQGETILK